MKKILLTAAFLFAPLPAFAYLPSQLPHTHGVERIATGNVHPSRRILVSETLLQQMPRNGEPTTLDTYRNDAYNLTLQYPASWRLGESLSGTLVSFVSPIENASDHIRENVNVMVQDLPENAMTLETYSEGTLRTLQAFTPSMTLLASNGMIVGGLAAHSITYQQDTQLGRIQFRQVWFIRANTAFLFTFTATPESFETYEKSFATMLNTMKIGS
ncbi:DcrB-related protein [Candidatus Peregrinibacteria bacterium]|nr:DcrB-related protein [Candidatus Peregrinibacteria bacterium]